MKNRLKNRKVTDHEALPYLLWFCGIEAVTIPSSSLSEMNLWDMTATILYVVITVLGVFYVYLRNGGRKGYDVIHKTVVLGSVVAIRYLSAAIPIAGLVYLTAHLFGLSGSGTTFFDVVFFTVLYALYYERLGRHIRDTCEQHCANIVEPAPRERAPGPGELRVVGASMQGKEGPLGRGLAS